MIAFRVEWKQQMEMRKKNNNKVFWKRRVNVKIAGDFPHQESRPNKHGLDWDRSKSELAWLSQSHRSCDATAVSFICCV